MPKAGERATRCKNGHDLTLPDARYAPRANQRGGGSCRMCVVEFCRTKRGSTKSGPPSRYKGDEVARQAALAQGMKRCPECEQTRTKASFNRRADTADGLDVYCRECRAEQKRAAYERDHEVLSLRSRAATYGLTPGELQAMMSEQDGRCAICHSPCPTGRRLAVDHDHATGQVRGLLCANCNRALGLLQESAAIVRAAADYMCKWESSAARTSCLLEPGLPGPSC